ncbi:hypothetical protein [Longirhabdus pacifica]|uniref:hypothetical protein n=1 Tax=Longirhabdus pacifica TaxID=2305227 RepID=UPI001008BD0C|nr:hypothetical protein [Longirhabdus pacifica]
MITAKSYFLKANMKLPPVEQLEANVNQFFISAEDKKEIQKQLSLFDPIYPGAIELYDGDQLLIGVKYHDSVDGLWLGIITMLHQVMELGEGSVHFIYQPISLHMKEGQQHNIFLSLLEQSVVKEEWTMAKHDIFQALITGAEQFFNTLFDLNFTFIQAEKEQVKQNIRTLSQLLKNM